MPTKKIIYAEIDFISLCPAGANRLPAIYKDDDTVELNPISKFDAEKGLLLNVVYAPLMKDSQGDFADADVIEQMAHGFMARLDKDKGVDVRHNNNALPRNRAAVVESFIIQKGDERFADFKDADGETVDVTGGWATVIKIDDPELRKLYADGEWQGVSMGGRAAREIVKEEDTESILRRVLKSFFRNDSQSETSQEIEMTPEELAKALDERDAKLAETFKGIVAEAVAQKAEVVDEKTEKSEPVSPREMVLAKAREMKQAEVEAALEEGDLDKAEELAKEYDEIGKAKKEPVKKAAPSNFVPVEKAQDDVTEAGELLSFLTNGRLTKEDIH